MRTNIDINDELLQVAMEISHAKTKKAVVEMALKEYIDMTRRRDLVSLFGQVEWEGDLNEMRTDTTPNEWDN
ncbi:type II toxin-antitoxin system VapB family antitoxin [Spirosoma utsteinense]|uniref:Arc/MetJ family transcription regulator n=1 Tax=Spirosoma utsteinense TaxID=2585773 RepID=A0ABR6W8C9_9BACT|nr:type II toxin-antitoxin system VapB family antitoxin [Spirosoma utsteinense]MBC3784144.1 Arc/MetJ family transcription regulator [Spirosoma utsteinense]MBC3792767.1 Arc/MetJ family transcription regulator [Spirosoma utsteinense]